MSIFGEGSTNTLKQQQIEYSTMGLLSAYYSGCSEHMIKALMDGLRELLGGKYIDFINKVPLSNNKDAWRMQLGGDAGDIKNTSGELISLNSLQTKINQIIDELKRREGGER